jgi:uncharacterized cupredoxin-like copper-binding protein
LVSGDLDRKEHVLMTRSRPRLAARAVTGAALAVAVPALAAGGTTSEKLVNFKIAGPSGAKAGAVTFKVANSATIGHEMVVIRTVTKASKLKLRNGRASEAGSVGEVELKAGRAGILKLTLKPGHYALLCNVGSHYKLGMYKDFTVT